MGHILSSNTIYANAFLTELGRKYLFDPIPNNRFSQLSDGTMLDAFKIVYFSLSDPDYNYNINYGNAFESGDVANISGKNEDSIKGTIVKDEDNLISVNGVIDGGTVDSPYTLETNIAGSVVKINLNSMPTTTTTTTDGVGGTTNTSTKI